MSYFTPKHVVIIIQLKYLKSLVGKSTFSKHFKTSNSHLNLNKDKLKRYIGDSDG